MHQLHIHKPTQYIKHQKSLDENDIILEYSDNILLDKLDSIEQDKQDIENYNIYLSMERKKYEN